MWPRSILKVEPLLLFTMNLPPIAIASEPTNTGQGSLGQAKTLDGCSDYRGYTCIVFFLKLL